jgi:hypothetical protein
VLACYRSNKIGNINFTDNEKELLKANLQNEIIFIRCKISSWTAYYQNFGRPRLPVTIPFKDAEKCYKDQSELFQRNNY